MKWPSENELLSALADILPALPPLRDPGLLSSAIASGRNLDAYGTNDPFELAAHFMYAIIKNHPMIDGNKRLSWVSGCLFLHMNGLSVGCLSRIGESLAAEILKKIASGEAEKSELASFLAGAYGASGQPHDT